MAIADVLKCIAPEFDNVDSGVIACLISIAENQLDQATFEADYEAAVAYLVAHMLTIGKGTDAGIVTQKRVGDLMIMFATPVAISDGVLGATNYGREFVRIRGLHVVGVLCVS